MVVVVVMESIVVVLVGPVSVVSMVALVETAVVVVTVDSVEALVESVVVVVVVSPHMLIAKVQNSVIVKNIRRFMTKSSSWNPYSISTSL